MEELVKHYRSGDVVKDFKTIYANKKLSGQLSDGILEILKEIYEPQNRWMKKENGDGKKPSFGVGDILPSGELNWGVINPLNTNYTAHTYLKDVINNLCEEHGIDEVISFESVSNDDYYGALSVIRKMIRLLRFFKDPIFDENGDIFKILITLLKSTWNAGLKYTDDFKRNFKTYFPTAIRIDSNDDERGDFDDMNKGIDIYIVFLQSSIQVKKSIQIKGATCYLIGDKYKVKVSMNIEKYRLVSAFIFYDVQHRQIYIFKNDISKIEQITSDGEPAFLFPIELFRGKFDYDGNK